MPGHGQLATFGEPAQVPSLPAGLPDASGCCLAGAIVHCCIASPSAGGCVSMCAPKGWVRSEEHLQHLLLLECTDGQDCQCAIRECIESPHFSVCHDCIQPEPCVQVLSLHGSQLCMFCPPHSLMCSCFLALSLFCCARLLCFCVLPDSNDFW